MSWSSCCCCGCCCCCCYCYCCCGCQSRCHHQRSLYSCSFIHWFVAMCSFRMYRACKILFSQIKEEKKPKDSPKPENGKQHVSLIHRHIMAYLTPQNWTCRFPQDCLRPSRWLRYSCTLPHIFARTSWHRRALPHRFLMSRHEYHESAIICKIL